MEPLKDKLDGWESNVMPSIFSRPRSAGLAGLLRDGEKVGDSSFGATFSTIVSAAIGAGNTVSSVLSQNVALNGRGGRWRELSFLFAATGDSWIDSVAGNQRG